jgi:glutamate-1-semialdehyde aminotransferase
MLAQRIYLAPSPFEALFISLAHNEKILKRTIESAFNSFKKLGSTPSPFEALFISLAHNEKILKRTIESAFNSFKKLGSRQ